MIKEEQKVFQRIVGNGQNGSPMGDCMKATVATLFGIKYEDVPHFVEEKDWHKSFRDFIETQGYKWHGEETNSRRFGHWGHFKSMEKEIKGHDGVNGLFYAVVFSPKYYEREADLHFTHAVIIDKDFNIVFDPNPEYQGMEKYPEADYIGYNGVVSVDVFTKIK